MTADDTRREALDALFEPLRPHLDEGVFADVQAALEERRGRVQGELLLAPRGTELHRLTRAGAPVALTKLAFYDDARRREAFVALRAVAPVCADDVPADLPRVLLGYARRLAAERNTTTLSAALRATLDYDRGDLLQGIERGALLDDFLAPTLPAEVRTVAINALVESGGWSALERVTLFPHAPEDRATLRRAFDELLSRKRRLNDLSPTGFEILTAQLLREEYLGMHVTVVGRRLDRGVDVVVSEGAVVKPWIWPTKPVQVVQCKRWSGKVSPREADTLLCAALARGADAIFVTSSAYRAQYLAAAQRELPGLQQRVQDAQHPGVTMPVPAAWIRERMRERGETPPLLEGAREHVMLRYVDRDALRAMMGEQLAAAYDFSLP